MRVITEDQHKGAEVNELPTLEEYQAKEAKKKGDK